MTQHRIFDPIYVELRVGVAAQPPCGLVGRPRFIGVHHKSCVGADCSSDQAQTAQVPIDIPMSNLDLVGAIAFASGRRIKIVRFLI